MSASARAAQPWAGVVAVTLASSIVPALQLLLTEVSREGRVDVIVV